MRSVPVLECDECLSLLGDCSLAHASAKGSVELMDGPEIVRQVERQDHIWYFTGYVREGSVPDMPVKIRTVIRPKRVDVMVVAESGRPPYVEKVVVVGPRVLISGKISRIESRREFGPGQWDNPGFAPEWLIAYVRGLRPVQPYTPGNDAG